MLTSDRAASIQRTHHSNLEEFPAGQTLTDEIHESGLDPGFFIDVRTFETETDDKGPDCCTALGTAKAASDAEQIGGDRRMQALGTTALKPEADKEYEEYRDPDLRIFKHEETTSNDQKVTAHFPNTLMGRVSQYLVERGSQSIEGESGMYISTPANVDSGPTTTVPYNHHSITSRQLQGFYEVLKVIRGDDGVWINDNNLNIEYVISWTLEQIQQRGDLRAFNDTSIVLAGLGEFGAISDGGFTLKPHKGQGNTDLFGNERAVAA